MYSSKMQLFLICTGLGRVKRGFESYILDLATLLEKYDTLIHLKVLSGAKLENTSFRNTVIPNIHRSHRLWRLLKLETTAAFSREQDFFFLGMIPHLLKNKQAVYYLGEYRLYCHLFRFRKWFRLNYRLCLYTGGQAVPGLFDRRYDYVHHITSVYYQQALNNGVPEDRQFILPHVVNHRFEQDPELIKTIKEKAGGKKIILSVGTIDMKIKRMHLIAEMLEGMADDFFVVICGSFTNETSEVEEKLKTVLGKDGYLLAQVNRVSLGSFYSLANAFILCSPRESFGIVLVEAMYHQLPILVNDFEEAYDVAKEYAVYIPMKEINTARTWIHQNWYKKSIKKSLEAQSFAYASYTDIQLSEKYFKMFQTFMK